MTPRIESLEQRRLLTGAVNWSPANHKLTVSGSDEADNITVQLTWNDSIGKANARVLDGKTEVYNENLQDLWYVDIFALGGDDSVNVTANTTYVRIFGGDGKDTISDTIVKSPGHLIDAGANDDTVLLGQYGATWSVVDLGAGNDVASIAYSGTFDGDGVITHGNAGNDSINHIYYDPQGAKTQWMFDYGDEDNDTLTASSNGIQCYFFGGTGNDRIFGGNLQDVLAGDEGNDSVVGNGGQDLIYGNAGTDTLVSAGDNTLDWVYRDNADVVNAGPEDVIINL